MTHQLLLVPTVMSSMIPLFFNEREVQNRNRKYFDQFLHTQMGEGRISAETAYPGKKAEV